MSFHVQQSPPVLCQRVTICTCSRTGRHLATFTRPPGSSLYTLTTASAQVAESGQVAASSQVSASSQLAASCSYRVLSHQTLLWHHRLGHPSLPRLHSMHSRLLVSGLPMFLPSLPRSPTLPCLPCAEGWQRTAPHSSEFPLTTAPLQTLHMDIWGSAPVSGTDQECYFLLLGERFCRDLLVLRLHSDRGGELSSDLLAEFCRDESIRRSFTLPASPQQNGIAECHIGFIIEVARTSMIHATAPHLLWPFAVQYAAHQLNLWPRVSQLETSPTLRWTGKVGDALVFRGPTPSSVSQVDPPPLVEPLEISSYSSGPVEGGDPAADDTAATRRSPCLEIPPGFPPRPGAETEVEGSGGAATGGAGSRGVATGGADSGGAASPSGGGAVGDPAGGPGAGQPLQPDLLETLSPQAIPASPRGTACAGGSAGCAGGAAGAGGTRATSPGGTRGTAGTGGAGATSLGGVIGAGGAGPSSFGGTAGAAGAGGAGAGGTRGAGTAGPGGARTGGAGAAGAGGAVSAGGAGGTGAAGIRGTGATGAGATGAAGPGGARTRGAGAARTGGAASARGATKAAGTGGAGGTAGARDAGAGGTGGTGGARAGGPGGARTRAAGARGAGGGGGAGGGTGAAGTGGAGVIAGARGVGGAGARGAAGAGGATRAAGAGGAGAASAGGAGAAGTAPRRSFFYPQPQSSLPPLDSVLRQVLSLPSSIGLTPPLLCPPTDQSQPQLLPGSWLPSPAPHTEVNESQTERREPETRASTPVHACRVARPRPPTVPGTHGMALRPSSVPQCVVLPEPPASSLPHVLDPESDLAHAASPTVTRLLATVVTVPDFESTAAFSLVTELVHFADRSRLDYVASLVTGSESVCPPSVGGEPALSSDVLEDRHFELECLAAALPRFASMLLCPEGDPDALDIPTPRSYAEAIAVDGMWIFRVKRPLGSLPVFKARYVARCFSHRQGVDFVQSFSPTPKMTTLWVLLHVAALSEYELHSLDFSTAFLQGSLHEEIWLRRPPGFTYPLGRFLRVLQRFGFQFSSPQPTPLSTDHSLSTPPSDESVEPSGPYLLCDVIICIHWTPEWLRQQILQEDYRRRHTGGGAANKTAKGYGAAGESRGRGGGRGRGRGRGFGRGRGRAATTAKETAEGEKTTPTERALDAIKKVQQPQQPHGEVLAGVDATTAWAKAASGNGDADWKTWHERLCHINIPMLQKLVKDGSLKGLEVKGAVKEIGSCPTCLETKFTKFPFTSGTGPAKAPLALVHMDVVGPTMVPSLSSSRYFLTIVDDHTRAVWVYSLKTKGEVAASVLKEWMPRAQRENGHKVKVIRTDNGGEFIGADFEAVLKKKGIQHQLTVPYNPQQNGIAERFNRTLQEGARTLLGRAGLLDPFWVIALRQVALVKNRVLMTVGDKQTIVAAIVPFVKTNGVSSILYQIVQSKLHIVGDVKTLQIQVESEPLGAVSTMAGPEERGGKDAGSSGEAQAQGQPRDSAMAPMQPSLGPPRDEPKVFGLDKFNGDNFAEWSFKMENIFDHYDLLEVMEGTEKRPKNDPEKSPWVWKSAQGYLLLGQALGSSQIRHIKPFQREPEKGPKAWAALKGVHAPATAAVAVVLERQMAALRIEEDEAVEERVLKFFDLLTRLEGADFNYNELKKKTKLLALLPDSWSSLIINLNRDLPHLSLEDVKRAILQEDFRRRELASADGAGAASIGRRYGRGRGRGRGGGRFGGSNYNGGRGSSGYGNDNKNNGRGRGRFDGECHFCHKSAHMWRDCYKLPDGWTPAQCQDGRGAGGGRGRGRGGRGGRGGGAASMKSAGNESESRDDRFPGQFFFMSTQASAGPEKDEGFEEPAAVGKVTLHSLDHWTSALGQQAEVKGMGKAIFKGADGKMVCLKNVLWVPNLAANLISVRRLQKAGMDTSSKGAKTYNARLGERILWDLHEDRDVYNEMWQIPVVPMPKERQVAASISTKGEAVGSGDGANGRTKEIESKKCNLGGTSKLGEHEESGAPAKEQHKDEENPEAVAEEEYEENMWGTIASAAFSNPTSATGECDWLTLHRRMGHVALPILQQLVKNEMVAGIRVKGEPDEVLGCPTCMQAKFTRYPFSSSEATAKAPLDEVVMGVVAPLKLGAAGAEYFLTIVDVYTRMTWVYVLSKKSDVAETVKTDWLPMVERQQDRLVKAIRTDRGGEFLSKEFGLWLKNNGIRHSLTMPYSPEMNGIAERANRTITETARGLLIEAGLPDYFWPDAVRSACVAKNRALTHVGADKWVPYVEWIGRKPKVDMLRVFGCMCMALVLSIFGTTNSVPRQYGLCTWAWLKTARGGFFGTHSPRNSW
ncbi:unnamed protein product [Closterium sp. NIES-54]